MRRSKEEAGSSDEEEVTETVVVGLNNLTIETAGTEEEATEGLEAALQMDIDEEGEVDCEGEEEDDGTQGELGALKFFTQDSEPIRTTLVGACIGFNDMSPLEMMCAVPHR